MKTTSSIKIIIIVISTVAMLWLGTYWYKWFACPYVLSYSCQVNHYFDCLSPSESNKYVCLEDKDYPYCDNPTDPSWFYNNQFTSCGEKFNLF